MTCQKPFHRIARRSACQGRFWVKLTLVDRDVKSVRTSGSAKHLPVRYFGFWFGTSAEFQFLGEVRNKKVTIKDRAIGHLIKKEWDEKSGGGRVGRGHIHLVNSHNLPPNERTILFLSSCDSSTASHVKLCSTLRFAVWMLFWVKVRS